MANDNHPDDGENTPRVAILVDNYFEQAEFTGPKEALEDAGMQVEVIGTTSRQLQGLNHIDKADTFTADKLINEVAAVDYDAVVLPGGAVNADHLRANQAAKQFVRDIYASGKPVAAICHAPWVLVSADLVDGHTLTSYHTIQDDIRNAGGEWVDEAMVRDGNLITSRHPGDVPVFSQAVIAALG